MHEEARNYSTTELDLYNLVINISSIAYLLKRVDFDGKANHSALTHIIKIRQNQLQTELKGY